MENNMKELSMENLANVTGGLVVVGKEKKKYWLVRQDGSVIGPAPDEETAIRFAKTFATSPEVITLDDYKKRFGRDLVW